MINIYYYIQQNKKNVNYCRIIKNKILSLRQTIPGKYYTMILYHKNNLMLHLIVNRSVRIRPRRATPSPSPPSPQVPTFLALWPVQLLVLCIMQRV